MVSWFNRLPFVPWIIGVFLLSIAVSLVIQGFFGPQNPLLMLFLGSLFGWTLGFIRSAQDD